MHLYYEPKTIWLFVAGMASTKLIILQGISGTGKTSLPYAFGKYVCNPAVIASVQPSWRDRTELFGYFNEFSKKFNETEVLRRIYEASFTDDINVIILDELNIARVEYYFAEMLSLMEMPDADEWKIELVPSSWENDPVHLKDGKLLIPQNTWYIGTANNDDSTFSVSDKVYDRALTINIDNKGMAFDAPDTPPSKISYSSVEELYRRAVEEHPLDQKYLDMIEALDAYVIKKFRVAFGNRIMKQLKIFVPVYVACGGDAIEGIDHMLATKVFRKFEMLNLALIRDDIKGLINYLNTLFGKDKMKSCIEFLERLQKSY
jgi:5-methylcytosine-specific restriction endonuclease McrBC GTP-binding regulatory subunit McrB